jgi:hypothetical protein
MSAMCRRRQRSMQHNDNMYGLKHFQLKCQLLADCLLNTQIWDFYMIHECVVDIETHVIRGRHVICICDMCLLIYLNIKRHFVSVFHSKFADPAVDTIHLLTIPACIKSILSNMISIYSFKYHRSCISWISLKSVCNSCSLFSLKHVVVQVLACCRKCFYKKKTIWFEFQIVIAKKINSRSAELKRNHAEYIYFFWFKTLHKKRCSKMYT